MLRTRQHILFSALLGAALAVSGCGDDDTKGDTTAPTETVQETTVQPDTAPAETTVQPETTQPETTVQPDTAPAETAQPEVVNDCTPDEAGKGFVGAPCTKDCQCQTVNGLPLTCYNGFYMSGFSFCSDYADRRTPGNDIQEDEGVDTIQFSSDCFPDVPPAQRNRPIYAKICTDLDQCKAISAAYTHCGTGSLDFPWSPGSGTYCPTSTGSNRTLSLHNTCIIGTVPPFDGSYVD